MKMRDCPSECGTVDTYENVFTVNMNIGSNNSFSKGDSLYNAFPHDFVLLLTEVTENVRLWSLENLEGD